MGSLGTILAVIFFISFMTFVTFFGRLPALRNTPIATLYRLIWIHTPNALLALDQRLTSGKLSTSLARFGHYMMYDRHPTVVIFFVVVLVGSEALYIPTAWPVISPLTKFTAVIAIVLPYVFLYLACAADPGFVTHSTLDKHMSLYPYDYALFHPGRICRTCDLPKPPRSKHCSICKKCVARADHHCIFINSCVGYGNHHWFLLLLASTALLTTYGAVLGLSILSAYTSDNWPGWTLWPGSTTLSWTRWFGLLAISTRVNIGLGGATLLALLISPLVWGLLLYTLYLVYCGTTTNESLKWSEWKEDIQDGYAFSRHLPARRNVQGEPRWTRWPAQPERILITTSDGRPPPPDYAAPGVGEWERIPSLRDVENVYDLGFWDNLKDIFDREYPLDSKLDEPMTERRRYERRPGRNGARHAHPP